MVPPISKKMPYNNSRKLFFILFGIVGLATAFLFQNFDVFCLCFNQCGFYDFNSNNHNEVNFVVNKLLRYITGTLSSVLIINSVFQDSKFSKSVTLIQILILIIFFPLYFYFAFSDILLLTQLYQKLNIILINPIVPFILGISYYFKRRKL
jgi:hypothetical protein